MHSKTRAQSDNVVRIYRNPGTVPGFGVLDWDNPEMNMKTLMMVLVLCGAVATPAFAEDAKPAEGKQAGDTGEHKGGKC